MFSPRPEWLDTTPGSTATCRHGYNHSPSSPSRGNSHRPAAVLGTSLDDFLAALASDEWRGFLATDVQSLVMKLDPLHLEKVALRLVSTLFAFAARFEALEATHASTMKCMDETHASSMKSMDKLFETERRVVRGALDAEKVENEELMRREKLENQELLQARLENEELLRREKLEKREVLQTRLELSESLEEVCKLRQGDALRPARLEVARLWTRADGLKVNLELLSTNQESLHKLFSTEKQKNEEIKARIARVLQDIDAAITVGSCVNVPREELDALRGASIAMNEWDKFVTEAFDVDKRRCQELREEIATLLRDAHGSLDDCSQVTVMAETAASEDSPLRLTLDALLAEADAMESAPPDLLAEMALSETKIKDVTLKAEYLQKEVDRLREGELTLRATIEDERCRSGQMLRSSLDALQDSQKTVDAEKQRAVLAHLIADAELQAKNEELQEVDVSRSRSLRQEVDELKISEQMLLKKLEDENSRSLVAQKLQADVSRLQILATSFRESEAALMENLRVENQICEEYQVREELLKGSLDGLVQKAELVQASLEAEKARNEGLQAALDYFQHNATTANALDKNVQAPHRHQSEKAECLVLRQTAQRLQYDVSTLQSLEMSFAEEEATLIKALYIENQACEKYQVREAVLRDKVRKTEMESETMLVDEIRDVSGTRESGVCEPIFKGSLDVREVIAASTASMIQAGLDAEKAKNEELQMALEHVLREKAEVADALDESLQADLHVKNQELQEADAFRKKWMRQEVNEFRTSGITLREKLESEKSESLVLRASAQKLQADVIVLQKREMCQQGSLEAEKARNEELQAAVEGLRENAEAADALGKVVQANLEAERVRNEKLQSTVHYLQMEVDSADACAKAVEADLVVEKANCGESRHNAENLRTEVCALMASETSLRKEIETQRTRLQARADALEADLAAKAGLEACVSELKQSFDVATNFGNSVQTRLEAEESRNRELRDKIESLQIEMDASAATATRPSWISSLGFGACSVRTSSQGTLSRQPPASVARSRTPTASVTKSHTPSRASTHC